MCVYACRLEGSAADGYMGLGWSGASSTGRKDDIRRLERTERALLKKKIDALCCVHNALSLVPPSQQVILWVVEELVSDNLFGCHPTELLGLGLGLVMA